MLNGRVDRNQKEIVTGLRRCGYSVAVTSNVGKGFPDIVCGVANKNFLFEIKDGEKPKSKKKLTEAEEKFFESWNGQVSIIESLDDAIIFINQNK